jgi:hypothetical protein
MPAPPDRRLLDCHIETFPGGFVTWGAVMEGVEIELAEGWRGTDSAVHRYAYVALPDGHSLVGLEFCRAADRRVYFQEVQGLHLNLPNDLFNDFRRVLATERGEFALNSPADVDTVVSLDSCWACLDGEISVVGLYGADSLAVSRSRERRGGILKSLYVEEIGWPIFKQTFAVEPSAVVLDVGWMVAASLTIEQTISLYRNNHSADLIAEASGVRRLNIVDALGNRYLVLVNFGDQPASVAVQSVFALGDPEIRISETAVTLAPGACRVFRESEGTEPS